ncbi:hypothetical protein MU582_21335 [Nocardioidaceae bacterium SCSIO 66511]|nr:hypothetical protein MU582_21335 [Nocardioidaceae bacterium SCSIO 66511]
MTTDDALPWARIVLVVGDLELPVKSIDRAVPCDLELVDDLLRFHFAASRLGLPMRITDVHEDLRELTDLVGVTDVLR